MARPYPLYDHLVQQVEAREDKSIDIKKICSTINNIKQTLPPQEAAEHYKEICALIIHCDILNNGGVLLSQVPFDGKIMAGGKGILYNTINLPPMLLQIIAQYIEMYSNI